MSIKLFLFLSGPKLSESNTAGQLIQLQKTNVVLAEKEEAIESLKTSEHEYLSFFVCSNPLNKLALIYKKKEEQYKPRKEKNMIKFPSWEDFITSVLKGRELVGFDGWIALTNSTYEKCHRCHYDYDAVVKMETFDEDSRWACYTNILALILFSKMKTLSIK